MADYSIANTLGTLGFHRLYDAVHITTSLTLFTLQSTQYVLNPEISPSKDAHPRLCMWEHFRRESPHSARPME